MGKRMKIVMYFVWKNFRIVICVVKTYIWVVVVEVLLLCGVEFSWRAGPLWSVNVVQ